MKTNQINVNIWDDYYEDNSDEKQETYVIVEDLKLKNNQKKEVLNKTLSKLKKLLPKTVKLDLVFEHRSWKINVKDMTHKVREQLLEKLDDSRHRLSLNKRPIHFISES